MVGLTLLPGNRMWKGGTGVFRLPFGEEIFL